MSKMKIFSSFQNRQEKQKLNEKKQEFYEK